MARRNAKRVKRDNMSQRMLKRLINKKLSGNPRKDKKDWTDKILKEIKEED